MAKEINPPSFLRALGHVGDAKSIALVNIGNDEVIAWGFDGVEKNKSTAELTAVNVDFERVHPNFKWADLFPEWIDEEEENEGASCPEVPMPDFDSYPGSADAVVARLPCQRPAKGWNRDVFRLQVHLVAANLAVRKGRRDERGRVKVVFLSECEPMPEIFRCDDLTAREGEWWMYDADAARLEGKVKLPVGSCELALHLWGEGTNQEFDSSKLAAAAVPQREAYATVLHSSDAYLCGAIALAQSIRQTGSTRDLILLHDKSINGAKLRALVAAGWTPRKIKRIRNPHAEKNSYNEYNYSKFRLWQLTEYDKIIFIDADIAVFRSLDVLFRFPQIAATGNDGSIFNSGVMVIEPSNCTFDMLIRHRRDVRSYNGGDQGFLNEIFVWWHRLPRRVNFLKNFWSNTTAETRLKEYLFGADPPRLYAVHYLGLKPWMCYRDYDCNWNVDDQRVYASDVAHRRWWQLHDGMAEELRAFCGLSQKRKDDLEWERTVAKKMAFPDGHWSIDVTDGRKDA
ncbi:UDP-glucuronate:xylan alpha-glucuronosyltransferase 2-like isoform X2 [Ananas comosus]|nr:UDP-glucuronate:xylan alpha-glucuronosyltransferase 2-like isoform X2 [Ananas comosus]OAY73763.1 UDP-glucuronate:xylan alpha-glucuronosyltransferase 2 [Ananas comosus]